MTNQHPITPPPDLLDRWNTLPCHLSTKEIFVMVAQWGADQELEACCEWLTDQRLPLGGSYLRTARRPKPPSLKEQALEALFVINDPLGSLPPRHYDTIRRALETLPND